MDDFVSREAKQATEYLWHQASTGVAASFSLVNNQVAIA